MSIEIQRRRGTAAEHTTFTGAAGELTVNTTNKTIHVHDGSTVGGFETAKASDLATKLPLTGGTLTGVLTVDGDVQLGDTLSTGATISFASSGRSDSTDLFVDDAADDDFIIVNNRVAGDIALKTNQTESLRIASNGDISFYDTSGSAKFFWDSSAERLGIGTSSPSNTVHLASSNPTIRLEDTDGSGAGIAQIQNTASGNLRLMTDINNDGAASSTIEFEVDGTERMRIESTGNVVFSNSYQETVYAITGTSPAINPINGTIQTWAVTALSSPTITMSSGQSMTLMVVDSTSAGINWPVINWVGGNAPTLATTGYTVMTIWKVGTTLYGSAAGDVA